MIMRTQRTVRARWVWSLILKSYIVSSTWNVPIRWWLWSKFRRAGLPLCEIVFTLGAHFGKSARQVRHGRQGYDNEVWPPLLLDPNEVKVKRDRLDRLAKTLWMHTDER